MQGTEKEFLNDAKILGTAKHFLGDGGTYLGIDQGDTRANEENMRVIHGEPYFASLNSCVRVVMASFNSWNGSKVHGNKYLLTEVLKDKMNYKQILKMKANSKRWKKRSCIFQKIKIKA